MRASGVTAGALRALRRWARVARVRFRRWKWALTLLFAAAFVGPSVVRLAGGSPEDIADTAAGSLVGGAIVAALLLGSGGPAAQLRSGAAVLWLQKPVRAPLFWLDRLTPRLGATVVVALALTAVALLAGPLHGWHDGVRQVVGGGINVAVAATILVCVTWALSGWGLPQEGALALLLLVGLFILRAFLELNPEGAGWTRPLAELVAFPMDEVAGIGPRVTGRGTGGGAHDLVTVLAYAAGWVAVGLAGTTLTSRSPLPRDGD